MLKGEILRNANANGDYEKCYDVSGADADGRRILKTAYKYGTGCDTITLYRNNKPIAAAKWNLETLKYYKLEV